VSFIDAFPFAVGLPQRAVCDCRRIMRLAAPAGNKLRRAAPRRVLRGFPEKRFDMWRTACLACAKVGQGPDAAKGRSGLSVERSQRARDMKETLGWSYWVLVLFS